MVVSLLRLGHLQPARNPRKPVDFSSPLVMETFRSRQFGLLVVRATPLPSGTTALGHGLDVTHRRTNGRNQATSGPVMTHCRGDRSQVCRPRWL